MTLPETSRKVTRKHVNFATYEEQLLGKHHEYWAQRRLGNSYTSNLPRRGWGIGKKFNKEHGGHWPHAHDATGSSHTGRIRRFFENAQDFIHAKNDGTLHCAPLLRVVSGGSNCRRLAGWNRSVEWWEPLITAA
jgi:hypothetical protein